MLQGIKYLCLILTLLAWVVFPLPECYLTKPNCSKRNNTSCQTFNLQQTAKAAAAVSPGCAACPKGGQPAAATHQAPAQDEGRLLMASLSPKFLLQQPPDVPQPLQTSILTLPARSAIPAASRYWSPVRGGLPDPIPILQRKQTLLI